MSVCPKPSVLPLHGGCEDRPMCPGEGRFIRLGSFCRQCPDYGFFPPFVLWIEWSSLFKYISLCSGDFFYVSRLSGFFFFFHFFTLQRSSSHCLCLRLCVVTIRDILFIAQNINLCLITQWMAFVFALLLKVQPWTQPWEMSPQTVVN